jgi:ADP-heptose:LPS heptosyltransferase
LLDGEFVQSIELITKNFQVYPQTKSNKRTFFIDSESIFLIFADSVNNKVIQFIKQVVGYGVHVLVLSANAIEDKLNHKQVTFVSINQRYYIHTFLLDPSVIKFVSGFGEKGERLAKIFSQFNNGVETDIIYEANQLRNYYNTEKAVLIKTLDGIGDLLMTLPTAKTYSEKGYSVDFLVWDGREEVLKNVPYVRNIFNQNNKIYLSRYSRFFNISFKMSDYNNPICRQHRIYTTANLCGLKKEELVIDKPEIFLTSEVIDDTRKKFGGNYNTLICFNSFDSRRSLPEEAQQNFIDKLDYPTVVDSKFYDYKNCNNLTGKTSIRDLFSLVFLHNKIITTDTSVLHVAGAFDKECLFLPSTINHGWRTYKTITNLIPDVKCYPCNESNRGCDLLCLKNIDYKKIERWIR